MFTTPDPVRVDGVVRSTKPLRAATGRSFAASRCVRGRPGGATSTPTRAPTCCAAYAAATRAPPAWARSRWSTASGRIGPLDTVFYDTLIDENAASHIALGQGFDWAVGEDDRDRINRSELHIDFMIGSPEMVVTGSPRDGTRVPVLDARRLADLSSE